MPEQHRNPDLACREVSGRKYVALLLHDSAPHPSQEVEVTGDTREELLQRAWDMCLPGRYVHSLWDISGEAPVKVYSGHEGWLFHESEQEVTCKPT